MRLYLIHSALIGVTETFTEGDQDGPWRDLRALCGTEPDLCDAAGGNGKCLFPGQAGRDFSYCGGSSVRTRVVVFYAGRCNEPGGVPDYPFDPCCLRALARPYPGVGQSPVRQAQSRRTFDRACPGAAHGEHCGDSDRADEGMPCAVVAGLPRADSGWQSPQRQRASPWRLAWDGRRGAARPGARAVGPAADDHRRRHPVRRRPCPGAVVVGSSAADPSATRLGDRRPELLHDLVLVWHSTAPGAIHYPPTRPHAVAISRAAALPWQVRDRTGLRTSCGPGGSRYRTRTETAPHHGEVEKAYARRRHRNSPAHQLVGESQGGARRYPVPEALDFGDRVPRVDRASALRTEHLGLPESGLVCLLRGAVLVQLAGGCERGVARCPRRADSGEEAVELPSDGRNQRRVPRHDDRVAAGTMGDLSGDKPNGTGQNVAPLGAAHRPGKLPQTSAWSQETSTCSPQRQVSPCFHQETARRKTVTAETQTTCGQESWPLEHLQRAGLPSLTCVQTGVQVVYKARDSLCFCNFVISGLHYKRWSGLRRSGSCNPN